MSGLKVARSYEEDFDPDWYLNVYYKTAEGQQFFADSLIDIFESGDIHGEKLLDIGTGPSVHSVISASRHVTEIHLSDLVDKNRVILQQWLDGTQNVTPLFEYLMQKESDGTTLDARVAEVREKVKRIYPINLRSTPPIEDIDCKYDVITSSLCLESVAKTTSEYSTILAKIADMLRPGGHLVLVGDLDETFYRVGDFSFDILKICGEELKQLIADAGFEIKFWHEEAFENEQFAEFADYKGSFAMAAQKV